MASTDELRAQLRVAELEEKLVNAKKGKRGARGSATEPTRKLKGELREARLRYRAARDGLEVVKDERGRLVARSKEDAA
jgi:hypothetical protein